MRHLTLTFTPTNGRLDGRYITARGLHGLLFGLLQEVNQEEASWLHTHPAPKPFSLVPLYTETGTLAGLRLAAVTGRVAALFSGAWEEAQADGRPFHLGPQAFTVSQVVATPGPGFAALAASRPARRLGLRFLSPTSFKQGPGSLPLPLPANVFNWPFQVWQAFAPRELALADDWLAWVERNVFVVEHRIETATVAISKQEQFTGFVGDVWFRAEGEITAAEPYLRIWQALGDLATFCGVGHKTTMGMGAVEKMRG
ncbi:MAG: CRISPR system precrRNA processing endoribonuclease RAMP protein Cas6 [Chloroflexota bacterium]